MATPALRQSELWRSSALELRELIRARRVSPAEVAEEFFRRIESVDPAVHAFTAIYPDRALSLARTMSDDPGALGSAMLGGVPYALKDMTDTAGIVTTYGSRAFETHVPTEDAAVARKLRSAGGVFVGKTNTPEFGRRATTAFGLFAATKNPWNLERTAGGSSGGSAAAVAAGMVPVAEGGDAGGSIRGPASCCGVVGLKPSRGRVSDAPKTAVFNSLFTHGCLTRTVRDAALVLDVIGGAEEGDPYPLEPPRAGFLAATGTPPPQLRIALLTGVGQGVDREVVAVVESAAAVLEELGHTVELGGPDLSGLAWIHDLLGKVDAAAHPPPGLVFSDPYCRLRYEQGKLVDAAEFLLALEEMRSRARKILSFFASWDCLVTPTLTMPPQAVDSFLADVTTAAKEDVAYSAFEYPFNMTGQPAMSVPAGFSQEGLPIGVQIIARPRAEAVLLSLAAQYEEARSWAAEWPEIMGSHSGHNSSGNEG